MELPKVISRPIEITRLLEGTLSLLEPGQHKYCLGKEVKQKWKLVEAIKQCGELTYK